MSIFASHTQRTIPVPFDPPHTVTIRKLTGREFDRAQAENIKDISGRGWSVSMRRLIRRGAKATDADVEKAVADPLNGLDRFSVIRAGLVAWSYPESITPIVVKGANGEPDVTVDAIEDLDEESAEWLAREIMRLTKPSLFATTEEEIEAAQKELSAVASVA